MHTTGYLFFKELSLLHLHILSEEKKNSKLRCPLVRRVCATKEKRNSARKLKKISVMLTAKRLGALVIWNGDDIAEVTLCLR